MRLTMLASAAVALSVASAPAAAAAAAADKITKESIALDRDKRPYYLFVPSTIGPEPVPLVIVLHGSGRNGRTLVDPWSTLAARERFIVAGPDAVDRTGWQVPDDGPAFLYFLVEAVKTKHAIDPRRVYVFGHSAGAGFGVVMALMESEYFAAAAVHAGGLQQGGRQQLLNANRKIPIAIFQGTNDEIVPVSAAREARDVLSAKGFPVTLTEIPGHTHNYYGIADDINQRAWEFLKPIALEDEPHYQIYSYQKK